MIPVNQYRDNVTDYVNNKLGDKDFLDRCKIANVEPTRRQARRFYHRRGLAARVSSKELRDFRNVSEDTAPR